MVEVERDYDAYRDSLGFVHPTPNSVSHNGIRFTAESLVAIENAHQLTDEMRQRYYRLFYSCFKEPGLLQRHPKEHLNVQEGPDDYVAMGLVAKVLNTPLLSQFIVFYGKRHFWTFSNVDGIKFSLSAFLGRQLQLVAHLYFASNINAPSITKVVWMWVILTSTLAKPSDQDAHVLSWMLVKTARNVNSFPIQATRRFWISRFKKKFPSGIGVVLGEYFGDHSHPSARHLLNEWGE